MKQVITLLAITFYVTFLVQERDRKLRREVADMLRAVLLTRNITRG